MVARITRYPKRQKSGKVGVLLYVAPEIRQQLIRIARRTRPAQTLTVVGENLLRQALEYNRLNEIFSYAPTPEPTDDAGQPV